MCILFSILGALKSKANDAIQISLLSCSPGEELYSIFGHSAIRIKDESTGRDIVYNYGTFDFNEPNFYFKFMKGKLNYILSRSTFNDFTYTYILENRTVYEQIFSLDSAQKSELIHSLQYNALPAHRAYKYDFFWDNCSTRVRDKVQETFRKPLQYPMLSDATFRDYLHSYLLNSPWSKFGIDLILGLPADKHIQAEQAMFLPLEMMKIYDSTHCDGHPISTKSKIVLAAKSSNSTGKNILTPIVVGSIICVLSFLAVAVFRRTWLPGFLSNFVFLLGGCAGIIISFLWFFSDHITTDYNLHLIWANPLLLFYPWRNKLFSKQALSWIFRCFSLILTGLILLYPILPQAIPLACFTIWLSMLIFILSDLGFKNINKKFI